MIQLPITEIIIIIVLIIFLIVASSLIVTSTSNIIIGDDVDQKVASKYLKIVSYIGWISTILLIGGAAFLIFIGPEIVETPYFSIILTIVYWFIIIIFLICGIYSSIGAYKLNKGKDKIVNKKYITYSIIVAIISLVISIGIFIYYMFKTYKKSKNKKDVTTYNISYEQWKRKATKELIAYKYKK